MTSSSSTATRRSVDIVRKALEAPARTDRRQRRCPGEVVVEKVKGLDKGHGYDALVGEYGDLFEKDRRRPKSPLRPPERRFHRRDGPTTETVVTDIPEKEKAVAGGSHDHGGGMDF